MQLSIIGIDLGKTSCSLVGLDAGGKVVLRRRLRRDTIVAFCSKVSACVVAMEACCGAHHIGRALAGQGHEIRLMSPEYVRPYVKAQKNDDRDAEAIAEAASRPTMRFVTLKSEEQLDMQTLHRVRDRLVGDRTSLMNQIRSLLLERGHVVAQGRARLAVALTELLDGEKLVLACRIHELIVDMRRQWVALDERIKAFDTEFAAAAKAQGSAKRLLSIPGIGALNATALVAAVGDAGTFARGRDLAAWLGLVPRQVTTGGRPKLLGITKRGSKYLRKMLIQGARAALPTLKAADTRWAPGCAGSWPGRISTRPSSPWQPRWLAPCGHCCATGTLTRLQPWRPETGSVGASERRPSMSVGGNEETANAAGPHKAGRRRDAVDMTLRLDNATRCPHAHRECSKRRTFATSDGKRSLSLKSH